MFTPPSGATLELSQTLFEVVEGDLAMRTTRSVCVILANDQSGLERDIVLNVETVTDTATSKLIAISLSPKAVMLFAWRYRPARIENLTVRSLSWGWRCR